MSWMHKNTRKHRFSFWRCNVGVWDWLKRFWWLKKWSSGRSGMRARPGVRVWISNSPSTCCVPLPWVPHVCSRGVLWKGSEQSTWCILGSHYIFIKFKKYLYDEGLAPVRIGDGSLREHTSPKSQCLKQHKFTSLSVILHVHRGQLSCCHGHALRGPQSASCWRTAIW